MSLRKTICTLSLTFLTTCALAQDIVNFTQFFINPYTINPSYAGIEGRSAFFLTYRKQWASIEGGPTIVNLSYHSPLKAGLNFGVNIANDTRGIVSNSGLQFSAAYALVFDNQKFIRFGISAGGAWNTIDLTGIEAGDPILTDPAIAGMLDQNFSILGNAGISLHLKSFHLGASLPNIFAPSYISKDAFTVTEVKAFESVILNTNYRFYFGGDKHVFEPYFLYRINAGLPSQYEAAGVLHLNHLAWIGGSFKQDFGISALGGLKVGFLSVGASYSIANSGANELSSPTFEIQLSYLGGTKKKNSPAYSFVNTEKEKVRKTQHKSASEMIAEKRKQDQINAKKQQEELAKKKEEEAKQKAQAEKQAQAEREALAKKQAEPPKPIVIAPVVTPPIVAEKPVAKHDGGPRLKSESFNLDMPMYDTAHHEEQARIGLVEEHSANPTAQHEDPVDFHPNAERHEFVKRGGHKEELDYGDYVIVGVFKSDVNSDHFVDGLTKLGFKADYGHLTEKNLWYVYIAQTKDINVARTERDKYRKMKIFKDAWLLTVHE